MSKIKHLILVIFLIIICFSFCGCYDQKEVNDYAYVMAIGIDKGKTNKLKITFQLAVPTGMGDPLENSDSGEGKSTSNVVVEASSFNSAISIANTMVSKKLKLSHSKIIIFSKALAFDGIEEYVSSFINYIDIRPDTYILISECDAEEFIQNTTPQLEVNPAKYYDTILKSYKYSPYNVSTNLHEFYNKMTSSTEEPIASVR